MYILKEKEKSMFKKFKRFVENGYDQKLKTFGTNQDGEFLSKTSQIEEGIKRQLTALYTLQHGVVYQRNRIIMNTTRSLLKSMQVLAIFWGKAIWHAVYLINRLLTEALEACISYEAWFDKTPHFEYLRFFGCSTYVKTAKPYITRLDNRSQKMVYFGVKDGTKAHRLYDPQH